MDAKQYYDLNGLKVGETILDEFSLGLGRAIKRLTSAYDEIQVLSEIAHQDIAVQEATGRIVSKAAGQSVFNAVNEINNLIDVALFARFEFEEDEDRFDMNPRRADDLVEDGFGNLILPHIV